MRSRVPVALWRWLRGLLARLRPGYRKADAARRSAAARARFWAEVRAGEREAEARSRP